MWSEDCSIASLTNFLALHVETTEEQNVEEEATSMEQVASEADEKAE